MRGEGIGDRTGLCGWMGFGIVNNRSSAEELFSRMKASFEPLQFLSVTVQFFRKVNIFVLPGTHLGVRDHRV
jgi:hypothetical protein